MVFDERWRKWEVTEALEKLRKMRGQFYEIKEKTFELSKDESKKLTPNLDTVYKSFWSLERQLNNYVTWGRTSRTQELFERMVYDDLLKRISELKGQLDDPISDPPSEKNKLSVYVEDLYGSAKALEDKIYKTISQDPLGRTKAN